MNAPNADALVMPILNDLDELTGRVVMADQVEQLDALRSQLDAVVARAQEDARQQVLGELTSEITILLSQRDYPAARARLKTHSGSASIATSNSSQQVLIAKKLVHQNAADAPAKLTRHQ